MNLRHVGITVKDIDLAKNFYCNLLGFEIKREMLEQGKFIDSISGLQNVSVTTVKMIHPESSSSGMLELLKYESHDTQTNRLQINNGGITHFAITVKDLRGLHKKLKENNVEFNCKPSVSDDGGALVTFCRDFEGNLIELVEIIQK